MKEWHQVKPLPVKERGIYRKYKVKRYRDPDGKHDACEYFVIDWNHDKFATIAMRAYAIACAVDHPELSKELIAQCDALEAARRTF